MNTSIVAEVRLQLEGLSHTQEEERKEGESDHVIAIYKRLERAAAIIHPLQNHLQVPRTQQQHAPPKDLAMALLENECRLDVALLAQEQRRAAEALQVQEQALTRLQEQVQILESQVQEAQQLLAQAHEILIRSDPAIYRDLQMVMGVVGKSTTRNSSSVASISMEGSTRDESTLNVRGKMRKQRENAGRFLILKRDPLEQIPVDTRRKSWKKLPAPDLNQMGNRSTRSVTSRCSGSSSIPSDGDSSYSSSQSCGSSLAEGVPRTPTRIRFESVQTRLYIIKH
jgi:hypothetical protein